VRAWIALVAAALALAGCGGDGDGSDGGSKNATTMIDWDLSHSHTTADVDWPQPDLDAASIKPDGAVRIKLPGGREFTARAGEVHEVFLRRRGETLVEVQLNGPSSSVEDAHAAAAGWADDWDLPQKPLDDFVKGGPEAPNAQSSAPAKDGFAVAVKLLGGFGSERTAAAAFQFGWVGRRGGDPTT
jgi:hypothetical protein